MRGGTCFDPHQARRKLAKIFQHPSSIDALADNDRARNIDPVHLEYRLRNIKPNRANLAHGRLPSMWFASTQPPYGTSMPKSGRRPQHQKLTWRKVRYWRQADISQANRNQLRWSEHPDLNRLTTTRPLCRDDVPPRVPFNCNRPVAAAG